MEFLVSGLNEALDLVWPAAGHQGRYLSIVIAALLSAVLFLYIFRRFSNQAGIQNQKKLIVAHLLQMRLFQHQLSLLASGIKGVLYHNLRYVLLTLPPLLVLIIPLVLITMQVDSRCGYAPLKAGDEFIISLGFKSQGMKLVSQDYAVDGGSGISLLTPAVRIPRLNRIYWRARIEQPLNGAAALRVTSAGAELGSLPLAVGHPLNRFSPSKRRFSPQAALFHSGSGFIPAASRLESITVDYPRAQYSLLGIQMDAIVLYFVCTLFFALLLKPVMRVKF